MRKSRYTEAQIIGIIKEHKAGLPTVEVSRARRFRQFEDENGKLKRLLADSMLDKPACIVSGNGAEFTSRVNLEWAGKNGIEWHSIDPGKSSRTGSSRASKARCATNCSTRNCSAA